MKMESICNWLIRKITLFENRLGKGYYQGKSKGMDTGVERNIDENGEWIIIALSSS